MSARVSIRARPLNGRAPNPAPVRRSAVVIEAAKGRNAKLAGRNKKAQSIEDNKWREGMEAAAAEPGPLVQVAPLTPRSAALVLTEQPRSVPALSIRAEGAQRARLGALGVVTLEAKY